jgi:hypothetical protein
MFENNLLAVMSHSRLVCLYVKGGTGALVDLEMGFEASKAYAQWISGVESVKKMLGKQLKDFTAGVQGSLKATTGGAELAKALLAEVRAQWYEMVSWIDEFYKQLTEEANFKPEPAWRLVGRCGAAIFDAMAETRTRVALIEDPRPLENKVEIIWCVLQCHITMQKFIWVRFQGHPVIVKEITMFMISERVDPTELKNMVTKMKTVEDENKSMKTTLARLEENYNALKRSLENLREDVKPIKLKVSKM